MESNAAIVLTPEKRAQVKLQLVKRLRDRRWRLDNLYRIIDADGIEIQFRLNLAQKILFFSFWYLNLILKSRQHGITTFICIFYLDICLFNSNVTAGIIAHNKEDAQEFFERVIKYAYDHLPEDLKLSITATQDSVRKLKFSNGSSIRVTTSGRSGVFQLLHISELGKIAAQYPAKAREIVTGALNAIHAGKMVTIESTAEGREGVFYDLSQQSQALDAEVKSGKAQLTKMDYKFFFFGR